MRCKGSNFFSFCQILFVLLHNKWLYFAIMSIKRMIYSLRLLLYKYGLIISALSLILLLVGHYVGWNNHNGFLVTMLLLAVLPLFGRRDWVNIDNQKQSLNTCYKLSIKVDTLVVWCNNKESYSYDARIVILVMQEQLFLWCKNSYYCDVRTVILVMQEQLLLWCKNSYSCDAKTTVDKSKERNVQMFKYSLGPLFHTQVRAYIII